MRTRVVSLFLALSLIFSGCAQWHYCQPIGRDDFTVAELYQGRASLLDGTPIRVNLVIDRDDILSPINADLAAWRIATTLDWYMLNFPNFVPAEDWTIYVASEDSAIWPNAEEYPSTMGCSYPGHGLFPPLVAGEQQIVIADHSFSNLSGDGFVTICHETLHVENYLATGNMDYNHANSDLWVNCW